MKIMTKIDFKDLRFGGLVPFTTIDYPGKLSSVVFCQGCDWKCKYCHNRHLRKHNASSQLDGSSIKDFLSERAWWIDAVVFSGGEPTLQEALPTFISEIKSMNLDIGLHTAAPHPESFKEFLWVVDWVGFDIKAPLDIRYDGLTGDEGSAERVKESLSLLLGSGLDFQLRTTFDEKVLNKKDLYDIEEFLISLNLKDKWKIQEARPVTTL
jgi:pyruvate formate lyase activating enzyme